MSLLMRKAAQEVRKSLATYLKYKFKEKEIEAKKAALSSCTI